MINQTSLTASRRWASGIVLAIGCAASHAPGQFTSSNVQLRSHIPLSGFAGAPTSGNDCWGYTSLSGREYALMVVRNSLAVVEVTNPSFPVIVGQITHSNSLWGDVKVYQNYCYVSNEASGGIDVIDLSQVDNGTVTLVQRLTAGGLSTTHNVAMNVDSGYLYLCGSNIGGGRLLALSLANPANPVIAGQVSSAQGSYSHDAQIVSFTSGPYAGREIAFSCNGGTGLDIYDVTNKSNMFRLSRTVYPNLSYCHQAWLSEDRQYLYVNDETDNVNETNIIDVSDLNNPVVVGSYNSGIPSTDHNLYVKGQFIFEADYRGGTRIFCAANPEFPVQVGWFDTYPANDNGGYDGAWSVYPFFDSGLLLVSDIQSGLFVLDVSQALSVGTLSFDYPANLPQLINPQGGTTLHVDVSGQCGAAAQAGTAQFHYDIGDGFVTVPMTELSPNVYEVNFPAAPCAAEVHYYVTAQTDGGATISDPAGAPATTYHAVAANSIENIFADNFENDLGWTTAILGATDGFWERAVPINDPGWEYDPPTDGDGSGKCFVTDNALGNSDVDNGSVQLISPLLDMTAGNVTLAYSYYLRLTVADGVDRLLVEISSNGNAGPWTTIATHTNNSTGDGSEGGGVDHEEGIWTHVHISEATLAQLGVTLTNTMKVRFTANDSGTQSIVEAGVDAVEIHKFLCQPLCAPADITCDGAVNINDLLAVIGQWGACPTPPADCPADIEPPGGNGQVDINDLLMIIANWS